MKERSELESNSKKLLINQVVIGVTIATGYLIWSTTMSATASLYGMFVALAVTVFLRRGVQKAEKLALTNPKTSMGVLYFGAVQRFVLVLGLLIIGLGVLKLDPIALAVTFGITQFAYVFNFSGLKKNSN